MLETSEHEPKRVGRKESRLLDYMEIVRARRETFIHSYRNRNWVLEKKRCIEKLKCIKIKKQLNNRRNRDSDCKDAPTKNKQSSKIAFACKLWTQQIQGNCCNMYPYHWSLCVCGQLHTMKKMVRSNFSSKLFFIHSLCVIRSSLNWYVPVLMYDCLYLFCLSRFVPFMAYWIQFHSAYSLPMMLSFL